MCYAGKRSTDCPNEKWVCVWENRLRSLLFVESPESFFHRSPDFSFSGFGRSVDLTFCIYLSVAALIVSQASV